MVMLPINLLEKSLDKHVLLVLKDGRTLTGKYHGEVADASRDAGPSRRAPSPSPAARQHPQATVAAIADDSQPRASYPRSLNESSAGKAGTRGKPWASPGAGGPAATAARVDASGETSNTSNKFFPGQRTL